MGDRDGNGLMRATYYDPASDLAAETAVADAESALALVQGMGRLASGRGRPTVEFVRDDGASLAVSSDGERAFMVWIDPLGDSHHSVGGAFFGTLVFDYFGSWSEARGDQLVSVDHIAECLAEFFSGGSPATGTVVFSPD